MYYITKGGYLDFSHLTEIKTKYYYITEIYMRKKKIINN